MKKNFPLFICVIIFCLFSFADLALAVEDPRMIPNNKVGIHIFFPSEILDAAALVNSNGGEWGYVTIPIQAGDKDIVKWQKFMDDARTLKVIPIIRLATENYFFNTKFWRTPTESDILDFVNFLTSLSWPTKNRYVIVFNEVNRADEWGESPNPQQYAKLLSYATTVFKSKNQNFFIISAGLDNAAVNVSRVSMNQYDFLRQMNLAIPGIFFQIDGLGSHSYPNPAFAKPPTVEDKTSISSFRFEKALVESLGSKNLPVFITETGWSNYRVPKTIIPSYYETAFTTVWNHRDVVAVTPFVLTASAGPFVEFSLTTPNGSPSDTFKSLVSLKKSKGAPSLEPVTVKKPKKIFDNGSGVNFQRNIDQKDSTSLSLALLLKWLLKL